MDVNVVAKGTSATSWSATADSGNGTAAHQMVAYWASGASEYHYYFLYEVLDTTVSASAANVTPFSADTANSSGYSNGQYVSYDGKVYVYSSDYAIQYSTATKDGQNQPSRQGFASAGKSYSGLGTTKGGAIYFFYTREAHHPQYGGMFRSVCCTIPAPANSDL